MLENLPDLSFQAKAAGALVVLAVLGNVVRSQIKARSRLPLPPGPPGHWLFGNALPKEKYVVVLLPRHRLPGFYSQSQHFAEWINQYGPVISLRLGPKVMIIIGRYQVQCRNPVSSAAADSCHY